MMKNLLLLSILAFSIQSCEEEQSIIPDVYWGEVSATKNGQPWSGLIYAQPNEPYGYGFSISIDVYNKQEFLRESLHIAKIPYEFGRNRIDTLGIRVDTLLTAASYATLVNDGDILGDLFKVYEGETESFISITSYNEKTGEVSGDFEVIFVFGEGVVGTKSDPTAPDTVRFANGKFRTKIRELP